jgi:hypothetical protein
MGGSKGQRDYYHHPSGLWRGSEQHGREAEQAFDPCGHSPCSTATGSRGNAGSYPLEGVEVRQPSGLRSSKRSGSISDEDTPGLQRRHRGVRR